MASVISGSGLGLFNTSLNLLGSQSGLGQAPLGRFGDRAYVNAATGNLVLRQQDEYLASVGIDSAPLRTYNSRGLLDDDNGDNWRLGISYLTAPTGAVNTANSQITRVGADGSRTVYTYDTGRGLYISTDGDGAHDTITWVGGSSEYVWRDGSTGQEEHFDGTTLRLAEARDRDGNTTTYTYDPGTGRLSQLQDASGQTVYFDYSGDQLTQIRVVSDGQTQTTTHYRYDAQNRLSQVIVDLTPENNSIDDSLRAANGDYLTTSGSTYVTTYTYDGTSQRVASITSGDGAYLGITYLDDSGNGDWRVHWLTDGEGRITQFQYDLAARRTDVTDPLGWITRYTYDTQGRLIQVETPQAIGSWTSTTYAYDTDGNVTQVTDGRGQAVAYRYDANGNRILEQDSAGNTLTRTFSTTNLVLTETVYINPDPDGLDPDDSGTNGSPSGSQTTRYAYDAEGHLRFVVDAEGGVTEHRYDTAGNRTATLRYSGDRYDLNGLNPTQTLSESQLTSWVNGISRSAAERTDYHYDFRGQLDRVTSFAQVDSNGLGVADGTESVTQYIYDAHGVLLQRIDPRGSATATVGDYTTTYTYDGLGRLLTTIDAANTPTLYSYDDANARTAMTLANGLIHVSSYDRTGTLISQSAISPSLWTQDFSTDTSGLSGAVLSDTNYVLLENGQLTIRSKLSTDPTAYKSIVGTRNQTFESGVIFRQEITTGDTSTGRYLKIGAANTGSSAAGTLRRHAVYFLNGNIYAYYYGTQTNGTVGGQQLNKGNAKDNTTYVVEVVAHANGTTLYVYEKGQARESGFIDERSDTDWGVMRTWIETRNLTSTTQTATASFSLDNLSESLRFQSETSYAYDERGLLRRVIDPTGIATQYLYDGAGRRVAVIDGTGALTETVYDADGRPVKTIRYTNRLDGTQLASLTDFYGNPANITLASVRPTLDAANDRVSWTLYDAAGHATLQLETTDSSAAYAYVTQTFYDGAGRITDQIAYYTSISLNGLPAVPTADDVLPLLAANNQDRHSRWFYDAAGRQIGVLDAQGSLSEIHYDAAGRVIETVAYATLTNSSLRATGTLDQLLPGQTAADIHSYTLYDSQGRVVGDIDGEGYLTESVYDVAGNRTQRIRYATPVSYTANATLADLRPSGASQTTTWTYTALNQVESLTTPDNVRTLYVYDSTGNLTSTTSQLTSGADSRTRTQRFDAQGQLIGELTGKGSAALAGLAANATQAQIDNIWATYGLTHSYDAAGRRISTRDANGNRTLFFYDEAGRLTHTVNALGEVTEQVYNAQGQVTQTLSYAQTIAAAGLAGGLVTSTLTSRLAAVRDTARDRGTSTSYTLRGLIKQIIDGRGTTTDNTYTVFGELTYTRTDGLDGTWTASTYLYNKRGQVRDRYDWGNALFRTAHQTYDAFGRLSSTTDANYNVSNYSYDRLGQLVTTSFADGSQQGTSYDAFGRTLTRTDANGHTTTYAYDDANRTTTVTTAEGIRTVTLRNAHGQTLSITDGNGNTTTYAYDLDGNLTSASDPLGDTTTKSYDNAGRLSFGTDANGVQTIYAYDAANRLLTRTLDPSGLALTTRYSYNAFGDAVETTDADGTVTRTEYDQAGQTTAVVVDPTGLNLRTEYTYDGQGNTLTVTEGAGTPDARVTEYRYDSFNRRIRTIQDPNGLALTTQYLYDYNDNLTQTIDANGDPTYYFYDARDRQVFQRDALGNVQEMVYDTVGNVIAKIAYATNMASMPYNNTDALRQGLLADPAHDQVTRYAYDADNRLTFEADALGYVTEYVRDGNGQVTETIRYATAIPAESLLTINDYSISYDAGTNQVVQGAAGSGQSVRLPLAAFPDSSPTHLTVTLYSADGTEVAHYTTVLSQETGSYTYVAPNLVRQALVGTSWQGDVNIDTTGLAAGKYTAIIEVEDRSYRDPADAATYVSGQTISYDNTDSIWARTATVRLEVDGAGSVNRAIFTPSTADIRGQLTAGTTDQHTRTLYDAAGRALYQIDALGYVTEQTYDAVGNVLATTRYAQALPPFDEAQVYNGLTTRPLPTQNLDPANRGGTFSAQAWIKVADLSAGDATYHMGIMRSIVNEATGDFYLSVDRNGALHFANWRQTGEDLDGSSVTAAGVIIEGEWAHVAVVWDGTANHIYVNGVEQTNLTLETTSYDWSRGHELGAAYDANGYRFVGSIGDADYVQGTAWSAAEIQAMAAAGAPTWEARARALAQTHAADANNQTTRYVYDAANRLTFEVDALGYVTGYEYDAVGNILATTHYAQGLNDLGVGTLFSDVSADAVPLVDPGLNVNPFTVSAWIKADSLSPADPTVGKGIVRSTHGGVPGDFFLAVDDGGAVRFGYWTQNDDPTLGDPDGVAYTADGVIETGRWYYVTASWDGTNQHIYVNGAEQVIKGHAPTFPGWGSGTEIGQSYPGQLWEFEGWIGDVEFQSSATTSSLESSAIRALYQSALQSHLALLAQTPDPNNRTISRSYDAAGRVESETDAEGGITRTGYDAQGNIVKLTDPNGNVGYYYYDSLNRERLHIDPEGYATETIYDAFDQVAETVRYANRVSGTYDETSDLGALFTQITTDTARDQHTQYLYDDNGQLESTIDGEGHGDWNTYDAFGNRLTVTDRNQNTTAYTYTRNNKLESETLPVTAADGITPVRNWYVYDAFGNLTRKTEAEGLPEVRVTEYGYDANNRQVMVDHGSALVFDSVTSSSVLAPIITHQAFDAFGNLIEDIDAKGNRTVHYYDLNNRRIATVDALGYLHTQAYDEVGNLSEERTYGDALTLPVDTAVLPTPVNAGNYRSLTYSYNGNNLRTGTQTPVVQLYDMAHAGNELYQAAVTTQTLYDANGNAIREVDGRGNVTYAYYDRVGNQRLVIDALGYATKKQYDANGKVTRQVRYANAVTLAGYDQNTTLQTLLDNLTAGSSADDRITDYTYDRAGRLRTETVYNVAYATVNSSTGTLTESAGSSVTSYEYDDNGNLAAVIRNGARTDYAYDGLNRQTLEQSPTFTDYTGAAVHTRTRTVYDGLGNVDHSSALGTNDAIGADDHITRYTYNSLGWKLSETDPEGAVIYYDYDANGSALRKREQLTNVDNVTTNIQTRYGYDALNRQTLTLDPSLTGVSGDSHEVEYNAWGDIVRKGTNGGGQEWYQYDALGRVWMTNAENGTPRAYVYDANGNATLELHATDTDIRNLTLSQILTLNGTQVRAFQNRYDAVNQLIDRYEPSMEFVEERGNVIETTTMVSPGPFDGGAISYDHRNISFTLHNVNSSYWNPNQPNVPPRIMIGVDQAALSIDTNSNSYGYRVELSIIGNIVTSSVIQQTSHSYTGTIAAGGVNIVFDTSGVGLDGANAWYYGDPASNYPGRFDYVVRVYINDGSVSPFDTISGSAYFDYGSTYPISYLTTKTVNTINFTAQDLAADQLRFRSAPAGTETYGGWIYATKTADGQFRITGQNVSNRNYEYEVYAGGQLVNHVKGYIPTSGQPTQIWQMQPDVAVTSLEYNISQGTSAANSIHRSQTYNAFGEIVSETDGRGDRLAEANDAKAQADRVALGYAADVGALTAAQRDELRERYTIRSNYNVLGRLARTQAPTVAVTGENGVAQNTQPITQYYYDLNGQLVGTQDANGYRNTQLLDATGQVGAEYHADGGRKLYGYDVYGNLRKIHDEVDRVDRLSYDKVGRVTRQERFLNETAYNNNTVFTYDAYSYDQAGNRLTHANGLGDIERYVYDAVNRIREHRSFGDINGVARITRYDYSYLASIGGGIGGYVQTVTDPNNRTLIDHNDYFGRVRLHKDLGGRYFTYTYNQAGWLLRQYRSDANGGVVAGQDIEYDYYANGYVRDIKDHGIDSYVKYEYDANGNRTFEGYAELTQLNSNGQLPGTYEPYEFSEAKYDALNRLIEVHDPKYRITYEYDAVGNRRRVLSYYHNGVDGDVHTQDYWYKYDEMNRFVTTMGGLVNGQIVRGTGYSIQYNGSGERTVSIGDTGTESYLYDAAGHLTDTRINNVLRARRINDAIGNVTDYLEYSSTGTLTAQNHYTYDHDSRLEYDQVVVGSGADIDYHLDAAGDLDYTQTTGNGGNTNLRTKYTYAYWDTAKESQIRIQATNDGITWTNQSWQPGFSYFLYDVNGHLRQVQDVAGSRTFTYINDSEGRVLRRNEIVGSTQSNTHRFYFMNGRPVGDVGNDGPLYRDYATLLAASQDPNYRDPGPVVSADFDQNYIPIGPDYPGRTPGYYVVQSGDTLQSIAQQLWGDSSLWYILADANAVTAVDLSAGFNLLVPNVVTNIHNNSDTYRPYQVGLAIGSVGPTLPEPPLPPFAERVTTRADLEKNITYMKQMRAAGLLGDEGETELARMEKLHADGFGIKKKGKCGGFGTILMAVVAVAASAFIPGAGALLLSGQAVTFGTAVAATGGLLAGGLGVIGAVVTGAVAGAAGSLASQAFGSVTGISQGFSWRAVATSALTGGIGGGITGALGGVPAAVVNGLGISNPLVQTVVGGAVGNTISQGASMLFGQQRRFDWRSLSATALTYGVGGKLNGALGIDTSTPSGYIANSVINQSLRQGAGVLVHERNRIQWADIAGNAIGDTLVQGWSGGFAPRAVTGRPGQAEPETAQTFPLEPYPQFEATPIPAYSGIDYGSLFGPEEINAGLSDLNRTVGQRARDAEFSGLRINLDNPLSLVIPPGSDTSLRPLTADESARLQGYSVMLNALKGGSSGAVARDSILTDAQRTQLYFEDQAKINLRNAAATLILGADVRVHDYFDEDTYGQNPELTPIGLQDSVSPLDFLPNLQLGRALDFGKLGARVLDGFSQGRLYGPNLAAEVGAVGDLSLLRGGVTNNKAQYVYDARAGRYRETATGQFAAARNLPWPDNAGFASSAKQTVQPGTIVDRYGSQTGRFLGEPGATVSQRGMAQGSDAMQYTQYRVVKPFDAQVGPAAPVPAFGASGGATQYLPGRTVEQLVQDGFLEVIK